MSILNYRPPMFLLALAALSTTVDAADAVSPECRGVAAGVVAAMRAAGELSGTDATEAAVVAARRSCMAAREDLGAAPMTAATADAKAADAEDVSIWDILTRDKETKPGNERLKRLRQQ